ncbi:MAG: hypothetical protein HPY85_11710 [Anaerolineae bacterium]|nr:hypothetical protein [Anaerolineae bacterium]
MKTNVTVINSEMIIDHFASAFGGVTPILSTDYELRVDENELETEVLYYHGGTGRFAMRESILRIALMEFSQRENSHLSDGSRSFDHLQSSSVILEEDGDVYSKTSYTAFGEVRKETGTSPTAYKYTGQRLYMDELGLMYYVARWYDNYHNQFIQPDLLIPKPCNTGDWH